MTEASLCWKSIAGIYKRNPLSFAVMSGFFAALVQVKSKKEELHKNGCCMNEQITTWFVRLVIEEGHTVVSRQEALQRARQLKLDLVEVQSSAEPPVCKIMDFHHEMYKRYFVEKVVQILKEGNYLGRHMW